MAVIKAQGSSLTMTKLGTETADTVIHGLTSMGERSSSAEEVDTTTLETNGKRFDAGVIDPNSMDLQGYVEDMQQYAALKSVHESRQTRQWTEEYVDGTTEEYDAYISDFGRSELTPDGYVQFTFTLRLASLTELTPVTP